MIGIDAEVAAVVNPILATDRILWQPASRAQQLRISPLKARCHEVQPHSVYLMITPPRTHSGGANRASAGPLEWLRTLFAAEFPGQCHRLRHGTVAHVAGLPRRWLAGDRQ